MAFIIERGVPLPRKNPPKAPPSGFERTLLAMEVGDSVDMAECPISRECMRVKTSKLSQRHKVRFSWRGSRVWRVA